MESLILVKVMQPDKSLQRDAQKRSDLALLEISGSIIVMFIPTQGSQAGKGFTLNQEDDMTESDL